MKGKINIFISCSILFLNISWTAPLTISAGGVNCDPFIFVNDEGFAAVAWVNGNYPDLKTQISFYYDLEWTTFNTINNRGTQVSPVCGMDSIGNSVVAWESIDETGRTIVSTQKGKETDWEALKTLSTSNLNSSLSLAINSYGETIIGWIDQENDIIQIVTLKTGSGWSDINTISTSGGRKSNLQLGIDNYGNGITLWEESNDGTLYSSQTYNGLTSIWSEPFMLNSQVSNSSPLLSLNNLGNAIATWTNLDMSEAIASIYENGIWNAPTKLSNNYSGCPLAIATGSDYIVSWKDLESDNMQGIKNISGSWGNLVDLSYVTPETDPSQSYSNSLFTVWNDPFTNDMYVSEYPQNGPTLSPTVISSEDMNVSPKIKSSITISILACESIVGADHVIKVNVKLGY